MLRPKLHSDPLDDTYEGGLRPALGLRDALHLPAALDYPSARSCRRDRCADESDGFHPLAWIHHLRCEGSKAMVCQWSQEARSSGHGTHNPRHTALRMPSSMPISPLFPSPQQKSPPSLPLALRPRKVLSPAPSLGKAQCVPFLSSLVSRVSSIATDGAAPIACDSL